MSKRSRKNPQPASPNATPEHREPSTASTQRTAPPRYPSTEELEEFVSPPLHGKTHPAGDMGFVVPTSDDEVRHHPHHPNEPASLEFQVDPDVADAAADLAGDLGAQFLEGATYAEDMSERAIQDAEVNDHDVAYLLEEEEVDPSLVAEANEDERGGDRPRAPAQAPRAKRPPRRRAHP